MRAIDYVDVFLNCRHIYLGTSPSIVGKEELILMTEKAVLIEKSFADAIGMIAAAGELPDAPADTGRPRCGKIAQALWISRLLR